MDETEVDTTTRIMVDIETLGQKTGAAILSVGAVVFDTTGVYTDKTFHESINLQSCQDAGLRIEASTLEWWMDQGDEAAEVLTGGDDLDKVLASFVAFYRGHNAGEIWANSPSFDCEMLEYAFDQVDIDTPWSHRDERDFRTLNALPIAVDVEREGVAHNALDDAINQARVVSATLREV